MENIERINSLRQVAQHSVGPIQEAMTQSEEGNDPDPAAEDIKDSRDSVVEIALRFGFVHIDKDNEQDDSGRQSVPGLLVDGASEASIGKNDEAVDEVDQVEQSEEAVVVVRTGYSHQGNRQQEDHTRFLAQMSEPGDDAHTIRFAQEDEEGERDQRE